MFLRFLTGFKVTRLTVSGLMCTVFMATAPVMSVAQSDGTPFGSAVSVSAPTFKAKRLSPRGGVSDALQGRLSQSSSWHLEAKVSGPVYKGNSKWVRQGNLRASQYQLDSAEAMYKKALAVNPNDAGAHHGLGWVNYLRTTSSDGDIRRSVGERYDASIQHVMDALRLQPNYVTAQLTLSRIYLEQLNRLSDAKVFTAKAYALQPKRSDVLTMVGRLMMAEGDVQQAIPFFEHATELNRRDHAAYYWLGKAKAQNHEYQGALQALNTSVWLFPNSAPAYHMMGSIYQQQGNQAAAESAYQKALLIKPEYLKAHLDLANLYQSRHDWPQALATLKSAYHSILPKWQPEKRQMALNIADMALQNRQPEVADIYYNEVLASNPDDLVAQKGVSQSKLLQAKLDLNLAQGYGGDLLTESRSQETLKQSLVYHRGNVNAKLVQTKLYGQSRDLDMIDADESRSVIETPSYSANDSLTQGELWTARFDPQRAEQSFKTAMRSAESPQEQVMVGDMLLTLGQPELAAFAFNRLLNHPDPAIHRAAKKGVRLAKQQQAQADRVLAQVTESKLMNTPYADVLLHKALAANHRHPEAHRLLGDYYRKNDLPDKAIRHYHVFVTLAPYHPKVQKVKHRMAALAKAKVKLSHSQSHRGSGPHSG